MAKAQAHDTQSRRPKHTHRPRAARRTASRSETTFSTNSFRRSDPRRPCRLIARQIPRDGSSRSSRSRRRAQLGPRRSRQPEASQNQASASRRRQAPAEDLGPPREQNETPRRGPAAALVAMQVQSITFVLNAAHAATRAKKTAAKRAQEAASAMLVMFTAEIIQRVQIYVKKKLQWRHGDVVVQKKFP